jgi:LuxR family transcriptional regulator, quorum-sensing system regulator SolR
MEKTKEFKAFLKSIYFQSCLEVQKICENFFKQTRLNYYNYVRIYSDGGRISLTNNKEWAICVFKNHKKHQFIFEETMPLTGCSKYVIWDNDQSHKTDSLLKIAREKYDIDHGFTIITCYEGYIELQYFATKRENKAINHFYINNLELINSFSVFFREKAAKIIESCEKERIYYQGHEPFWLKNSKLLENLVKEEKYLNNLKNYEVNRYYLSGNYKRIYLTKREAQCLTALIDGLTAKETAIIFDISPKTVRAHLENVKQKLNCYKRSDLLNCAQESGFRSIYMTIHALYLNHRNLQSKPDPQKAYFLQ